MYRKGYRRFQLVIVALGASLFSSSFAQTPSDSAYVQERTVPLPTVRVNVGFCNLFSDVKLSSGPSPFTQLGYQLSISQPVTKYLNISLDLFTGSVLGEETRGTTNINFKSTLFSQFLLIDYNLFPLLKPKADGRQLFRPFIGFGVGMTSFRTKGDLKDGNGRLYQFWTDGTIRAEAEGSVDPSESTLLQRDFTYETDLRAANLDGFKNYYPLSFSMPFRVGFEFQITKHIGVNASVAYVLNFTDLIDNVNENSVGERKGSTGNDNHIYGSLGLSLFLGNTKGKARSMAESKTIASKSNDKETNQSRTEETQVVEEEQPSAENTESVSGDTTDVQLTSDLAVSKSNTDEVAADNSSDDQNSISTEGNISSIETPAIRSVEDIQNAPPKQTGTFHWADLDGNGTITPNEVLHFIDLLFEGTSEHNVEDIQQLIDYYFEQE
jgi:hypothetical protein